MQEGFGEPLNRKATEEEKEWIRALAIEIGYPYELLLDYYEGKPLPDINY